MKRQNIKSFKAADSWVAHFDLKSINTGTAHNRLECIFWTRRDEQLSVQYFRPEMDVFYEPHIHSEYTVMICLAGAFTVQQFGETKTIGPGEVMISTPGVEHASGCERRWSERCEVVALTIGPQLMTGLANDLQLPVVEDNLCLAFRGSLGHETLHHCAQEIVRELRQREPGHKLVLETVAMRLVIETLRLWPREQLKIIAADYSPRLPQRDFLRAYEYMRRCRKDAFRLEHLCSYLGISKERFTRLFLASTNKTPANFYNRLLLERGRDLLSDPALSIKSISFELGFKTTSHFISTFRREFAAAPQEYRERALQTQLKPAGSASLPSSPADHIGLPLLEKSHEMREAAINSRF